MEKAKKDVLNLTEEIAKAIKRTKAIDKLSTEISITDVISKEPYTMVEVLHHWTIGIGFAKCAPRDTYNENIGVRIALARAVRDLVAKPLVTVTKVI